MQQHAAASRRLHTRIRPRDGFEEFFLTHTGPDCTDMHEVAVHADGAHIVRADVFGPSPAVQREPDCPVTWVRNEHADSAALSGVYIHAVRGAEVRSIRRGGRLVGTVVATPDADECTVAGVCAADTTLNRPRQARGTFEAVETALAEAGMDYSHVVRTWLFLDDILGWYDEFNAVRTDFYRERGVFDGLLPASTGIGGANPAGAAVVAAAFAVKPRSPDVTAQAVVSPLQCPATQYGSSFSRAVEVSAPDCRRLLVSGTAGIDPGGRTAHMGDVDGQIARTFEVVQALLESREMDWDDVTRATAYVRSSRDALAFRRFLAAHPHLAELPVTVANNVICREDLLFELEVDAWRGRA